MRLAAPLGILLILLGGGAGADLPLMPQTREVAERSVHDTLADADVAAADALRHAERLVRAARGILPVKQGDLESRATLVQPGVRGVDEVLSVSWVGASEGTWRGAYWIQSSGSATTPAITTIGRDGILLFLDSGGRALASETDITYHFLGVDGRLASHRVGAARILDDMPTLGRVDIGAAHATEGSASHPAAILVTPWNLHSHNVTMGMTLLAGERVLETIVAPDCADLGASVTTSGRRLLYALALHEDATALVLWHLEDGARVVDRTLARAELLGGARSDA